MTIAPSRRVWLRAASALLVALALAGSGGVWLAPRLASPPTGFASQPTDLASPTPGSVAAPAIPAVAASIETIERAQPSETTLFRLAEAPSVLVIAFSSRHEQARALNRVAGLVEKAGFPRDRVLTADEFAARLQAQATEPDDFYDGHDYRAADLARFFALAARDRVPLTAQERWVRDIVRQAGWLSADAVGALLSIPPAGGRITTADRATILRHEVSHAAYFTDPAYRSYTIQLWTTALTDAERSAIRAWLADEGYDPAEEDLMRNEAQAYLLHTGNPRYFAPAMIGMAPARYTVLRARLIQAIPEGWLKDSARSLAPGDPQPDLSEPPSPGPAHQPPPVPLAAQPVRPPPATRGDRVQPVPGLLHVSRAAAPVPSR